VKTLMCAVYTPEGKVFEGEAAMVVATALDGEVGILYNHAPLITALGEGSLRITEPGGNVRRYSTRGGFLEVAKNQVVVLTDELTDPASE